MLSSASRTETLQKILFETASTASPLGEAARLEKNSRLPSANRQLPTCLLLGDAALTCRTAADILLIINLRCRHTPF